MSDADGDGVTVSEDGVTVRKSLNTEQFKTPAVVFDVRSERAGEVELRIVDEVPETIPPEDVGFHPAYGGEHWSIQEGRARFERAFDPDEEYTTVYGVRDVPEGALDDLMDRAPEIEVAESGEGEDGLDGLVAGGNDLVRDVIKGERSSLPGIGGEDGDSEAAPDRTDSTFDLDESDSGASAGNDGEAASELAGESDPVSELAESGSESRDFEDVAAEIEAGLEGESEGDEGESESDEEGSESDVGESESDEGETGSREGGPEVVGSASSADTEGSSGSEEGASDLTAGGDEDVSDVVGEAFDSPDVVTGEDADGIASDEVDGIAGDEADETAGEGSEALVEEAAEDVPEPADASGDSDDAATSGRSEAPVDAEDVTEGEVGESDGDPRGAGVAEDGSREGDSTAEGAVPEGGVARVLAKELREGNVSAADRRLLRDELAADGSLEARIEHLQSRTSDLEAYTDALEDFLDRHGKGGAFEETREEVAEIRQTTDALEGNLDAIEGDLDVLDERVDDLEATIEAVEEGLDTAVTSVESLDDRLADVADDVEDLRSAVGAVEDVEESLEDLAARTGDLEAALDDVDEDVEEIEDDVEDVEERLDAVEGAMADREELEAAIEEIRGRLDDVEDVEGEVRDLRAEVDEMAEFRDRLSSAFGPE